MDVIAAEDGAGGLAFLRSLVASGLSGLRLVSSDAHEGLEAAIESVLIGASWRRCRTHAMRNLLTRAPKASRSMVATLVRTIVEQPDSESGVCGRINALSGICRSPSCLRAGRSCLLTPDCCRGVCAAATLTCVD